MSSARWPGAQRPRRQAQGEGLLLQTTHQLPTDRLGQAQGRSLEISKESESRAWRDIWSAGHGVGVITDIPTVGDLVDRLEREFAAAQVSAAWR